jgi:hypothetical protein
MVSLGDNGAISMNATFNTNDVKFQCKNANGGLSNPMWGQNAIPTLRP